MHGGALEDLPADTDDKGQFGLGGHVELVALLGQATQLDLALFRLDVLILVLLGADQVLLLAQGNHGGLLQATFRLGDSLGDLFLAELQLRFRHGGQLFRCWLLDDRSRHLWAAQNNGI